METGFVLRVVAVKEEAGLVGRAEERFWNNGPAEPIDHRARVQRPATDFKVVVHSFRGEVEELQVNPWIINIGGKIQYILTMRYLKVNFESSNKTIHDLQLQETQYASYKSLLFQNVYILPQKKSSILQKENIS